MRDYYKDKSSKQLVKILDKWFSLFIRLRDANREGYCRCCTCGRYINWKELDCGHYSKRDKAYRFNEKNCHAQCKYCNDYMKGEADKHARHIDKLYGPGTAEFLRGTENQKSYTRNIFELRQLIEEYKQKAKEMAALKGLSMEESISKSKYRKNLLPVNK